MSADQRVALGWRSGFERPLDLLRAHRSIAGLIAPSCYSSRKGWLFQEGLAPALWSPIQPDVPNGRPGASS